jgi:hypothetical protein
MDICPIETYHLTHGMYITRLEKNGRLVSDRELLLNFHLLKQEKFEEFEIDLLIRKALSCR